MASEFPTRVPLRRTAEEEAEEDRFQALYGAWSALSPTELARELAGFQRPWWVIGGWAIEAATGFRREREDTAISIPSCDVPAFVAHMSGRWHIWNNVGGVLHAMSRTASCGTRGRWLPLDRGYISDARSGWVVDKQTNAEPCGACRGRHVGGL